MMMPQNGTSLHDVGDAQSRERNELRQGRGGAEDLVHVGQLRRNQTAPRRYRGEFLLPGQRGALAAGARGQRLHRHGEEFPQREQREHAGRAPEQPVVQEDAAGRAGRPGVEKRVTFHDSPVARDGVVVQEADGVENAGPEVLQRARGAEDRDADEVQHEDGRALQVDDEDLAREGGHQKEERAEEEDLEDHDGKERLQIPGKMIRTDAGVVGPGSERTEKLAEEQAGKREDRGDERSGPAAAEIGELRDRLGEEDLNRVALEIAQDRRAEDGRDHDHTEKADADVVIDVGVRAVQQHLSVGIAHRAEVFAGDVAES